MWRLETERDSAIDIANLSQCRYCYRDFDSEEKANTQMEHLQTRLEFVCQMSDLFKRGLT